MSIAPTGTQYRIADGDYEAVVTELGATLRLLRRGDADLVWPFDADRSPELSQGQQLLPWPNRIRDGRYLFGGRTHELPISEPENAVAIHGLVRWVPWQLVDHSASSLSQQVLVYPQPGFPGVLRAEITHAVSASQGLVVTVRADNMGDEPVPFGYAAHPYLLCGEGPIDNYTVTVPFARRTGVDERMLPTAVDDVSGSAYDLRDAATLGGRLLDTAYSDATTRDGRWRVALHNGESDTFLWAEDTLDWVQLFTPPNRHALAVEPMTCGPDAFNEGPTHAGMIELAPGGSVSFTWGIYGR